METRCWNCGGSGVRCCEYGRDVNSPSERPSERIQPLPEGYPTDPRYTPEIDRAVSDLMDAENAGFAWATPAGQSMVVVGFDGGLRALLRADGEIVVTYRRERRTS